MCALDSLCGCAVVTAVTVAELEIVIYFDMDIHSRLRDLFPLKNDSILLFTHLLVPGDDVFPSDSSFWATLLGKWWSYKTFDKKPELSLICYLEL